MINGLTEESRKLITVDNRGLVYVNGTFVCDCNNDLCATAEEYVKNLEGGLKPMNTYSGAVKIKNYLVNKWSNEPDSPTVFSKSKLEKTGMRDYTGGDGAAIVWEGFYEWTKPSEIKVMENLLEGTGLKVYPTSEWLVEIV